MNTLVRPMVKSHKRSFKKIGYLWNTHFKQEFPHIIAGTSDSNQEW